MYQCDVLIYEEEWWAIDRGQREREREREKIN